MSSWQCVGSKGKQGDEQDVQDVQEGEDGGLDSGEGQNTGHMARAGERPGAVSLSVFFSHNQPQAVGQRIFPGTAKMPAVSLGQAGTLSLGQDKQLLFPHPYVASIPACCWATSEYPGHMQMTRRTSQPASTSLSRPSVPSICFVTTGSSRWAVTETLCCSCW